MLRARHSRFRPHYLAPSLAHACPPNHPSSHRHAPPSANSKSTSQPSSGCLLLAMYRPQPLAKSCFDLLFSKLLAVIANWCTIIRRLSLDRHCRRRLQSPYYYYYCYHFYYCYCYCCCYLCCYCCHYYHTTLLSDTHQGECATGRWNWRSRAVWPKTTEDCAVVKSCLLVCLQPSISGLTVRSRRSQNPRSPVPRGNTKTQAERPIATDRWESKNHIVVRG